MVGQGSNLGTGGSRAGQRYIRPHIGTFIGPLGALRGPITNLIHIAKQPAYPVHLLVRPWIGPYAPQRGPLQNLIHIAKQPAYKVKPYITPFSPFTPQLRGPIVNRFAFYPKQPPYPVHTHIQPWIGPYPKLGQISRNLNVRAHQPPYRTKPLIVPFNLSTPLPPAPNPVPFVVRAKQPRYATHVYTRPWIGPYPPLGAVSTNRFVHATYAPYPVHMLANTHSVILFPPPVVTPSTSTAFINVIGT